MKKLNLVLLIVSVLANPINSQNYRVVSVTKLVDHSKDFREMGYCYDINKIVGDTLYVQFYTQNVKNLTKGVTDTFSYHNGVLNFYDGYPKQKVRDSVYYNPKTKKREVLHMLESGSLMVDGWNPDQKRLYMLTGFKKTPTTIQHNEVTLCNCPTKPIKFEIFDNDTINVLNANGLKDGVWIEFYDTGEIMKKKRYKNGNSLGGYLYDKKGKVTHTLTDEANEIAMPIE